jgi:hypothetical protein
MRNSALHALTLRNLTVAGFVGTGGFLIRCSDSKTRETQLHLKKFRNYFSKNVISLISVINQLNAQNLVL